MDESGPTEQSSGPVTQPPQGAVAPRGMYTAKMDERGRLKLPADFHRFLDAFPEKKVFVTSLDRKLAQIFPLSTWVSVEKNLASYRAKPAIARGVIFNANDLGSEAEPDAQGRVLFSPELRKELEIENQQVRVYMYRGRIAVLSDKMYQEQKREASQNATENVDALENAGVM